MSACSVLADPRVRQTTHQLLVLNLPLFRYLLRAMRVTALLLPACWAAAQVLPPDESLTDGPGVESLNQRDSLPILSAETIGAASPSRRRGLFGRRGRDSSYVDTLGVGFFNKILAPVYPNPERAAALSFVLPGAGQAYNKRFAYIKMPVIYAGYAFLIANGERNRKQRNTFRDALLLKLADQPHQFVGTRFDDVNVLRTNSRTLDKNFQLSYIGVGILHLVQTLEAYTTAHLLDFDMDDSLSIAPVVVPAAPSLASYEATFSRVGVGVRWRFDRARDSR